MRIVNRNEFLSMPNGILYSRYEHLGSFIGLAVKEETLVNDWVYTSLIDTVDLEDPYDLLDKLTIEIDFKMDVECGERDGMYDTDVLFAVYDEKDVITLFNRLKSVLGNYPKTK